MTETPLMFHLSSRPDFTSGFPHKGKEVLLGNSDVGANVFFDCANLGNAANSMNDRASLADNSANVIIVHVDGVGVAMLVLFFNDQNIFWMLRNVNKEKLD